GTRSERRGGRRGGKALAEACAGGEGRRTSRDQPRQADRRRGRRELRGSHRRGGGRALGRGPREPCRERGPRRGRDPARPRARSREASLWDEWRPRTEVARGDRPHARIDARARAPDRDASATAARRTPRGCRARRNRLESGASRARTGDLLAASQTLSQLSYGPVPAKCSGEFEVLGPVDPASLVVLRRSKSEPNCREPIDPLDRNEIAAVELVAVRCDRIDLFARVR